MSKKAITHAQDTGTAAADKPVRRKRSAIIWSCGGVFLVLTSGFIFWLYTALIKLPSDLLRERCMSNEHTVGVAMRLYSLDWDEKLPPAVHWMDMAAVYITAGKKGSRMNPNALHCPAAQLPYRSAMKQVYGYAMNKHTNSLATSSILVPEQTLLFSDSKQVQRNAVEDKSGIAWNRHLDRANIAFVDGHVDWMSRKQANILRN